MKKNAALLFSLLLLITLACVCSSEATPPTVSTATAPSSEADEPVSEPTAEPVTRAQMGDTVSLDGYSMVANEVEDPAPEGILYTATEGTKLVAVNITLANDSATEPLSTNLLYATLIDSDGFTYTPELAGRDEQLQVVDLNQGEKVRGWISFEIPEDATPAVIKYEVRPFSGDSMESSLDQ